MKSGELYRAPINGHLILYPTADYCTQATRVEHGFSDWVSFSVATKDQVAADWWGGWLKCQVRYADPCEIFLIVSKKNVGYGLIANVLFSDRQGWIMLDYKNISGITLIKKSVEC